MVHKIVPVVRCAELGQLLQVRDASYVKSISFDGKTISPADNLPAGVAKLFQIYVDKVAVSEDARNWNEYKNGLLRTDTRFLNILHREFEKHHHISLVSIGRASECLYSLAGSQSYLEEISKLGLETA